METQTATFGAGCFWGVEDAFRQVPGVVSAAVGYMGGTLKNPNPGRGSMGVTDEEGKFTLRVNGKQSGAAVGKHKVAISKQIAQRELIPSKYNRDSKLEFEVPPEGSEQADFPLTSK